MSALPPGMPATAPGTSRGLNVTLVLDPQAPVAVAAVAAPGVDFHLHLVDLLTIEPSLPFLRRADALIVEVVLARPGHLAAFTRLTADQSCPVIAAGRDLTVADTRALIRAGAVDVLPLPLAAGDLAEAIETARRIIGSRPQGPSGTGHVVSFMRAVGGAGATALATQIGCLWAARRSCCLIDLDVQFGAAALYLDLQPPLGLLDLIEARDRLDATLFETIAARHASGLHVVAGASEIMPLDLVNPALVGQLLGLAAQQFEIVLVDLPPVWTSWSLAALSQSDSVVLVTNLSVPGLRQARRQLDIVEANGLNVPISIVLNRVPKKLFRTIDLGDSERVLRRKVDFTVADDAATVGGAIDQGKPLAAIRARSAVEADLTAIIAALDMALAA